MAEGGRVPEELDSERRRAVTGAVRRRYATVAREPVGQFAYPVGRESLERLGYRRSWIAELPPALAARFVGVGNPFDVRLPRPGERMLDVGCGCGVDAWIAATLVGAAGRAVGLDPSPEMLAWPRSAARAATGRVPELVEGSVEDLPFPDGSFDVVLSNGALNLATDKPRAFGELARVLRPGGALAAADLVVKESIPDEVLASTDAWSA